MQNSGKGRNHKLSTDVSPMRQGRRDRRLRERTSILLVEHKIDLVLHLAERAYVIVNGQIAFAGESAALQRDINLQQRLLGVGT